MKILLPLFLVYLTVSSYFTRSLSVLVTKEYLDHCIACGVGGHTFNDYRLIFHIVLFAFVVIPPFSYGLAEIVLSKYEQRP